MRTTVAAACSLLVLSGAVGCTTAGHASPAPSGSTARAASAPATADSAPTAVSAPPAPAAVPAVAKDPARTLSLEDGRQKVLYGTHGMRGSADLTTLARIPRGTLGIAVLCTGPGAVHVRLGPPPKS